MKTKILHQPLWMLVVMTFSLLPYSSRAEPSADSEKLARTYMATRPAVFKGSVGSSRSGIVKKENISLIASNALSRIDTAADWNEQNPEWRRMKVVIEQDISTLFSDLQADPHLLQIAEKIDGVFAKGLVARLTPENLNQLAHYYSIPPGVDFSAAQVAMLREEAAGIVLVQQQAVSGQRILPTEPAPDANEFGQVLSLFDEIVKIQLASADPGPAADRSGLQAIPMILVMGIQANFAKVDAQWKTISEKNRLSILAWRESSLAKSEREAIFESAKDIRAVVDVPEEM